MTYETRPAPSVDGRDVLEKTPKAQAEHDRITAETRSDIKEHWHGRRQYLTERMAEIAVSRQRIMDQMDFEILEMENEVRVLTERIGDD